MAALVNLELNFNKAKKIFSGKEQATTITSNETNESVDQSSSEVVTIAQWSVRIDEQINEGSVLCDYLPDGGNTSGELLKLRSEVTGTVREICVEAGSTVQSGEVIMRVEPCSHPTVWRNMCAECGADLREHKNLKASVAMEHSIPDLLVTHKKAKELSKFRSSAAEPVTKKHLLLGKEDEQRLHRSRKLVLLVDLDQTLVHTTNDTIPANLKLSHGPNHKLWYHTRFRPGTQRFLNAVSKLYELRFCTFGARAYAQMIARLLDPESRLFASRILSRDECFHPTLETANLKALFPCGDAMVCIIDDREDVWRFAPNLVHVRPYRFFDGTADINATPGLNKSGNESEGAAASSLPAPGTWFESGRPGKRVVRVIRMPKKKVEVKPVVEGVKMEEGEKVQEPAATKTRKLPVSWSRSKKAADRAAARADRSLSTAEASADSTSTTHPPSTAAVVSASTAAVNEAAMSESSTSVAAVTEASVSEASAGITAVSEAAVSESTDKLITTEGQTNNTSVANNGMSDCSGQHDTNTDTQIDTGNVTDKHTDNGIDKERSKDTEKVTEEDTANETKDKEIGREIESAMDKDINNVAGRDTNSMTGEGTNSVTDSDTSNVTGGDTKSGTVGDIDERMKQSVDEGQGGENKGGEERGDEGEWEELIEWEDNDDYLVYLEDILTRIHTAYYSLYDEMVSQSGSTEAESTGLTEETGSAGVKSTGLAGKTSSAGKAGSAGGKTTGSVRNSSSNKSNKTSSSGSGRAQVSNDTAGGAKPLNDLGTIQSKSPDLKTIVPYVRRRVLKGVRMVFSGVTPLNQPLETSVAYRAAVAMGASVQTTFTPPTSHTQNKEKVLCSSSSSSHEADHTTHVVAAALGTTKVKAAAKYTGEKGRNQVHLVTPDWLWCCADRWEHVDERLFPLNEKSSRENVLSRDSPEQRSVIKSSSRSRLSKPTNDIKSGLVKNSAASSEDLETEEDDEDMTRFILGSDDLDALMALANEINDELSSSSSGEGDESVGGVPHSRKLKNIDDGGEENEGNEKKKKRPNDDVVNEVLAVPEQENQAVKESVGSSDAGCAGSACAASSANARDKNFPCPSCDCSFYSSRNRDNHFRKAHVGETLYPCDLCEMSYRRKSDLAAHKRTVHVLKPHKCSVCGATFSQKSTLDNHLKSVHSNVRLYKCKICNKRFKLKWHYDSHLQCSSHVLKALKKDRSN